MYHDIGDHAGFAQTNVLPRAAGIGGTIHAVTYRDIASDIGLSHSYIHHIGIGGGNGYRADARRVEGCVGNGKPCAASVLRLPHTATGSPGIVRLFQIGMPCHGQRASTAIRPDTPVVHRPKRLFQFRRLRRRHHLRLHGNSHGAAKKDVTCHAGNYGDAVVRTIRLRRTSRPTNDSWVMYWMTMRWLVGATLHGRPYVPTRITQ